VLAAREPWRGLGDEKLLRRHARARLLSTQAMGLVTDGLLQLFASRTPWRGNSATAAWVWSTGCRYSSVRSCARRWTPERREDPS
jgi:DNA-directed RNA polymerase specialized sigma24 family protein